MWLIGVGNLFFNFLPLMDSLALSLELRKFPPHQRLWMSKNNFSATSSGVAQLSGLHVLQEYPDHGFKFDIHCIVLIVR